MKVIDALAIVVDLANENVLEEWQAKDNEAEEDRELQIKAVEIVIGLLATLRRYDLVANVRERWF